MKKKRLLALIILIIGIILVPRANATRGDINISVSPMKESVVLNPGDTYKSSFLVSNPGYSEQDLYYHIDILPFYVDEDYNPVFSKEINNDKQLMNEWVKVTAGEKGVIPPNEAVRVEYEIDVPESAPAGGQYACLSAVTDIEPSGEGGINIGEGLAINHVILAEITGNTIISGEILDVGLQSFLLGGKMTAYSTVKNDGNVHGLATYELKVYPLFSDEPIYNNEEEVENHFILPGRTYYNKTIWEETPMMGIFNVSYVVEFQGMKSEVHKMVVICPWWIIFIIILGIVLLVLRIVSLTKLEKMAKQKKKEEE